MKYIINNDFKLLVSSFMFLYFDVYQLFFDKDIGTFSYCNNISQKLFNCEYNLYVFERSTDIFSFFIKKSPAVNSDVDVPVNLVEIYSGFKKIKNYNIVTANNSLKYTFNSNDNNSLLIAFIKRFDDVNYIVPITFYFDWNNIIEYKYNIDLTKFLYNDKLYREKMNKIIFDIKNFY